MPAPPPNPIPPEVCATDGEGPLDLKVIVRRMILATIVIIALVIGALVAFREPLIALSATFVEHLGGFGVALGYFLPDAFTLPLPNDAFTFFGYIGGMSFGACVLWGSIGSLTGGSVGFLIGRRFQRMRWYQRIMASRGQEVTQLVRRYGAVTLLVAALTPIPYSLACWAAGAGGMKFHWFFLISLSRIAKVAFYLWLIAEGILTSFQDYMPAAT